ncbi:MAG: hypothetical protein F6K55_24790 [Moorea sp. SIO4A3]|nr:hypothetical protein [Moorena sp. SIO4A3]
MTDLISEILSKVGSVPPQVPPYFESLETYAVKKVSDADTIDVIDGSGEEITVRFVYIDAPETPKGWGYKKLEDKNQDNALYQSQFKWGNEGKDWVKQLVEENGDKVKLRITDIDTRYNRRIGEVYLLDGTFLQHSLVKEGLALIYYDYFSKCPREMAISLLLAEADAERQGKGLWQEPKSGFIQPWLFRPLKKKQKALLGDPDADQQLTEKIQTLCEDLEAGKMTKDQFEDTFKETLK